MQRGWGQVYLSGAQWQDNRKWTQSGTKEALSEHQATLYLVGNSRSTDWLERLCILLGDLKKLHGHLSLGVSTWAGVGPHGSRGPCLPQPF